MANPGVAKVEYRQGGVAIRRVKESQAYYREGL